MTAPSLSAARREAEEALRADEACDFSHAAGCLCGATAMEAALRSLLAALPAEGEAALVGDRPAPQPAPSDPDPAGTIRREAALRVASGEAAVAKPDAPQTATTRGGVLTREAFLRHLHTVVDTECSTEALHPSEIALCNHDAALRSVSRAPYAAKVLDVLAEVHPKDSQSHYLLERARALLEEICG